MLLGFSGGKQVKKIARAKSRGRVLDNRKWTFHLEDGNGKLLVEAVIVTFLGSSSDRKCVKLVETRTVHFAWLLNLGTVLIELTKSTAITHIFKFYHLFTPPPPPPEIPRDIASIPSKLKRLQRWWVSSTNTTANFLILTRLRFGMNFVVHLCGKIWWLSLL